MRKIKKSYENKVNGLCRIGGMPIFSQVDPGVPHSVRVRMDTLFESLNTLSSFPWIEYPCGVTMGPNNGKGGESTEG